MVQHEVNLKQIIDALEKNLFTLYYQPKISMLNGELCGAEALIRWPNGKNGFIPPDQFIHIAEESGIITDITKYVYSKLISELPQILNYSENLVVSFNVSGKDFQDEKFTQFMINKLKEHSYAVKNIEIEVTETILLDAKKAKDLLNQLSNLGVPITMDDFGTGHSGLAELSKWPFSTVKIDREFVNGIYKSKKNTEILQASIRMAHQLDIEIVAEGIEDDYTYDILQNYGCKVGQGYGLCRPLSLEDFIEYIKKYKNRKSSPVGVIYMAQLDHIQWKKTLIDAALYIHFGHTNNLRKVIMGGLPELRHTHCKLGKWYYETNSTFGHLQEYQLIKKPHKELHDLGIQLIEAATQNCSFETLKQLICRLSEESVKIINSLQVLENYWILEQHTKTLS